MIIDSIDVRELSDEYKELEYLVVSNTGEKIFIEEQKTGFGIKYFFKCNNCSSRREKIYQLNKDRLYCRGCLPVNIYRGIQNNTKGGEAELQYRMRRLAEINNIPDWEFPFNYLDMLFKRPKYMRVKKYERIIRKLQALENMRFQNILYNNKYESDVIDHVFKNRLYTHTLKDMKDNFINWYE